MTRPRTCNKRCNTSVSLAFECDSRDYRTVMLIASIADLGERMRFDRRVYAVLAPVRALASWSELQVRYHLSPLAI